jgi:hypothetical protein
LESALVLLNAQQTSSKTVAYSLAALSSKVHEEAGGGDTAAKATSGSPAADRD